MVSSSITKMLTVENNMEANMRDLPPGAAQRSKTDAPGATSITAAAIAEAPSKK